MIFDGKIFKIEGASDMEDCSMFAGLIALFEYDTNSKFGGFVRFGYFFEPFGRFPPERYVRCPGSKYNFSRDQFLCISAGMWKSGYPTQFISYKLVDGKDILSPANRGHELRCQNKKSNWFYDLWLKAEILFHAYATPTEESNQLIAMMIVAGDDYLKLWTKHNPKWRESISLYWDSWRNEKDFGLHVIETIKQKTQTA